MLIEVEMLVYCNAKEFLRSSFFKLDFIIGKYLFPTGFPKAHEFTFKGTYWEKAPSNKTPVL